MPAPFYLYLNFYFKGECPMVTKSQRIVTNSDSKMHLINAENVQLLERFKIDMAIRELAPLTQQRYISDLKGWFVFILEHQKNRSVIDMIDEDITEYLFWCKSQGNNANRMKFRISVVSTFYKFLRKKRLLTGNPTEFIEAPKRVVPITVQTYLTSEQVALMREKLVESRNTQLRLYATLSLSTMARVSAIASLRWNQIDLNNCVITGVPEKEGKIVDIYFNDEVKQLLLSLKSERLAKGRDDKGWLWYTGRCTEDTHIHKNTLWEWCKKIGKMIGVESLHPHDFRHSGATLLRNAGMTLEDISILLNHESTDTTQKFYVKSDKARINDIKSRLNY